MAVAAKSKAPASDSMMTPEKMKPLLAFSKQEPVRAAIGLTAEGEALILLDKKAKPKKVFSMFRATASKAKLQLNNSTLRFGRAEVDTEYDSGMVRFFVNKETPGNMRVKLLEVVKRIPYNKVEINVDPTLEAEPEEDETDGEAQAASAAAEAPAQVAPPPPAPPPPPVDLHALRTELAGLMQQAAKAGGDANFMAKVREYAGAANEAIKVNNANDAAAGIVSLKALLANGASAPAPRPSEAPRQQQASPAGPVAYGKARLAWLGVRKKMEGDLAALRGAIQTHYKDSDAGGNIDQEFQNRVKPLLQNLDESLADTLDGAINATEPNQRTELVQKSREIIKKYQDFIASDTLFQNLDNNPFVNLATGKVMSDTLATLSQAVH